MPEPERVPAYAPDGTPITVPKAEVRDVIAGGGRVMSPGEEGAEREKIRLHQAADKPITPGSLVEGWLAGQHAGIKGVGEAFGVPVDTGIAALFGDEGKNYVKKLEEEHPVISGVSHLTGQIRGAVGAAELTGGGGSSLLGRAAYGGAENVVQATTHDVNEGSLGRADINGEKLLANIPKHFAVGATLTGLFEGGVGALSRKAAEAAPAMESASNRLIGREVGEAGAAAERAGARIHDMGGGVPKNRAGLVDVLEREQAGLRKAETAGYEAKIDTLRGSQQTEAAGLSARQEAQRLALAKEGTEAVRAAEERLAGTRAAAEGAPEALATKVTEATSPLRMLEEQYAATRQSLVTERTEAEGLAAKLEKEREANAKELGETLLKIREGGVTPGGILTPKQFDEIVSEYLGIVGSKTDPNARWAAEEHLREVYKDELSAGATTSTEAASQHVERLKAMASDLEKAHTEALGHLKRIDGTAEKVEAQYVKDQAAAGALADKQIASFQKTEAKETQAAEREGVKAVESAKGEATSAAGKFEKGAEKERKALSGEHVAAEKSVPKPTGKTDVDPLLGAARKRGEAPEMPVERGAVIGASFSLLHGHPLTAATAMLGSFAAGRVRAEGNFLAARALRGLSSRLATVDEQVRRGVASLFGKAGTRVAVNATNGERKDLAKPAKLPSFDVVSRRVLEASANPSLVTEHVRQAMGPEAGHAPETFAATLVAAQRMQQWLEAMVPRQMVDPNSLTPQLDEPGISDTEKWEFMRSVAVLNDPVRELFAETRDGTISPEQIEAVKFVYGTGLYKQIQSETRRKIAELAKPLEYEREIAVGILLGLDANQILDRDFQSMMSASYEDKSAAMAPAGGSKPKSGVSQLSKDVQSTSEKVQRGEM